MCLPLDACILDKNRATYFINNKPIIFNLFSYSDLLVSYLLSIHYKLVVNIKLN